MKNLKALMMLAILVLIGSAHASFAQSDLLSAGKSMLGNSDSSSTGSMANIESMANGGSAGKLANALPLDKIKELIQKQGYSNITGLKPSSSGSTLLASATNSGGSPVSLLVNPMSGKVMSALAK